MLTTMPRVSRYFDLKLDANGDPYMEVYLEGIALLRLVLTNKGTAFSYDERRALGLEGLLPPQVNTLEMQVERAYGGFRAAQAPLDKYQYLRSLQERQEILFYALLDRHLSEMLPIVYTPTVGEAVKQFSSLYQNPRGLSLSPLDVARAPELLANYPFDDVKMIVATDSSAILGIGDQGYGGLAIPIGKLALYTVGGGVSPFHTMPVSLDVGTDRQDLLDDPFYLGVRQERLRGEKYFAFIDAFVAAVRARWPNAVIQWEDLSKETAFAVLERYQDASFNDDVQGTGAMALAGMLSACTLRGERLRDQRIAVYGAGAGGIGVASMLTQGMMGDGLTREEARDRIFVLDSKGLLLADRAMEAYKRPFAQPPERVAEWSFAGVPDLLATVKHARVTALLGLSGQPCSFHEATVRAMAESTERPVIFPLSNPTSATEALPEDLLAWTDGRAIVATGSPFPPVDCGGLTHGIAQGNNAFVFPGLGHGAILAGARRITGAMVREAAYALADYTAERRVPQGWVYPAVEELQEVSIRVAARVMARAITDGVASAAAPSSGDFEAHVRANFWRPRYLPMVLGRTEAERPERVVGTGSMTGILRDGA